MSIATAPEPAIVYPESDGEPMAETGVHVQAMIHLRHALEDFYIGRRDVFVSTDQNWYWNEGHPEDRLAPDLLVALGVPDRPLAERGSFRAWEENNVVPSAVFEMASGGTWRVDLGSKFLKYEELGVHEYFLFDPLGEFLVPRLQGFRLKEGAYRRILPDDNDVFASNLGFRLTADGESIRLIDAATGRVILTRQEQVEAERHTSEERARIAEEQRLRAEKAEAELAKLQTLIAQQNKPNGNGH